MSAKTRKEKYIDLLIRCKSQQETIFGLARENAALNEEIERLRGLLVGVVTIGRPVARMLDDGLVLEVTRLCTDGTKNAASILYGAAWRAVKAMGYKRLITYTLAEEPGTSLLAAGWKTVYQTDGGSWSRESRPRVDTAPIGQKTLWEATA